MTEMMNYHLSMPVKTHAALKDIAAKEGTTVAELLRRAARLLLFMRSISDEPGARLLVERRGGEIQEIVTQLI